MKDFEFSITTKILFGKNQIDKLSENILKYGKRVLLCYGEGSIKKYGIYDEVIKELKNANIYFEELSGIKPNPRLSDAIRGIDIARKNNIDFILAVGGGSVIDESKLIALATGYDGDAWDIVTKNPKIEKAIPIGVLLTTAATGSETDGVAVISKEETHEKLPFMSPLALPKFAIMNPEYTYTLPSYQTTAGIADIMSHTMESYFTLNDKCYLDNRFAESILKNCIYQAPIVLRYPNNYDARANIMWASSWAINGLLEAGKSNTWTVHTIEHELSAYYNVTHGVGLAILTPNWLKYVLNDETKYKIAEFGVNVFGLKESNDKMKDAEDAIKALRDFFDSINLPSRLSELNIDDSKFHLMAKKAVATKNGKINGFIPLTEDDVYEIYKLSL